jgi:hypothetical protein
MAWYQDLSTYQYLGSKYLGSSLLMLNVGWLEQGRAFNTGLVPPELTIRLRKLAQRPANLCKGKHICDLCDMPDDAKPIDDPSIDRFLDWIKERSGNGEIHVRSAAGKVYSAPVLIVHYVEVHGYCPPKEFVDAVLEAEP